MADDSTNRSDDHIGDLSDLFPEIKSDPERSSRASEPRDDGSGDDPEDLHALLDELVLELQRDSGIEPPLPADSLSEPAAAPSDTPDVPPTPPIAPQPADPAQQAPSPSRAMRRREPGGLEDSWASALPDSEFDTPFPDPTELAEVQDSVASAPAKPESEELPLKSADAAEALDAAAAAEVAEAMERESSLYQPENESESRETQAAEEPAKPEEPEAPAVRDMPVSREVFEVLQGAGLDLSGDDTAGAESSPADSLDEYAASLLEGGEVSAGVASDFSSGSAAGDESLESPERGALWTPRDTPLSDPAAADKDSAREQAAPDDFLSQLVDAIDADLEQQPFDVPAPVAATDLRRRAAGRDYIVFTLAGDRFAVPVTQVTELDETPSYTLVPNVPDFVLGVANLRGDIISVLDLRRLLGLESAAEDTPSRMLVVRVGEEALVSGLVVDAVDGIAAIPPVDVRPAPSPDVDSALRLEGIAGIGDTDVGVLDLPGVFEVEEVRRLVEA